LEYYNSKAKNAKKLAEKEDILSNSMDIEFVANEIQDTVAELQPKKKGSESKSRSISKSSKKGSVAKSEKKKSTQTIAPKKASIELDSRDPPLAGHVIVITGELLSGIDRLCARNTLLTLGATSPGSVSGKTTLLVAGGVLVDGREVCQSSKYKKAKDKNIPIMDEDEFDRFLLKSKV